MSLVVTVSPLETCSDPLSSFQSRDEKKALRLFKQGAVLHTRRGFALHRSWLEHKGVIYKFEPNSPAGRALQDLGTKLPAGPSPTPDSDANVERWVFAPETLKSRSSRWRKARKCAEDWAKHRGPVSTDISGLSERALATIRFLKRQHAMCMYPELLDVWQELNKRGLVEVNTHGGVNLLPKPDDVLIPWGPVLKLKPATSNVAAVAAETPVDLTPIVLDVALPVSCVNPQQVFQSQLAKDVLGMFRAGATLHVNRRKGAPVWWLSKDGVSCHEFGRDVALARSLVSLGRQAHAEGVVPFSPAAIPNASGRALEESWKFCPHAWGLLTLTWASARECAEDWKDTAGVFAPSGDDLPDLAKATMRTLQQKYTLPMYPELFEVWLALNAKGYLAVFPEGYAELVADARNVLLPPGPRLEVRHPAATA